MNLDTDKIVAAILTLAADGNSARRWDLIEEYFKTLDDMRQQQEERQRVRPAS
jgi:hypothetical protein